MSSHCLKPQLCHLALAVAFTSRAALGQPAPAPPAPPVTAAAAPTDSAATSTPSPPKSRATLDLEARFQAMRAGRGLTPEEVARRSVKNSAAIEAKQRAIENVDAQADQTLYAFWPKAKVSAAYTRLSPVDVPSAFAGLFVVPENATSFDAQLNVPFSDYLLRLTHAVAGSSRAREAAVFDRGATVASVDRDARVAFYTWVRAQAQEIIAAQALEQSTGHLKDASNAFEVGLVSKAEVLGAAVAKKNAELLVERARNNTELARLTLEVAMGDTAGRKYEVGEDVFAPNPALSSLPNAALALREAESRRMEFKSLLAAESAYREQAALSRIGDYPRLDGQAGVTYANPNQRYFPPEEKFHMSWQAGVALSWTPTDIGGAEAGRSAALARAAELGAQRRAVRDGLRIEIEQALRLAREARFTIDVAGEALAASEEGYRVRHELFRAGRATIVELTDAETDLTRTRLQLADAHVNARIALVQLNHALGRDTELATKTTR